MSVFTPLDAADIGAFLSQFAVGELQDFRGIAGGSENTNYFVDTRHSGSSTRFVLTLLERGPVHELSFFIQLLDCLHQAGLPVPYAITDRQGEALHYLQGKPALLQPRLPGTHPQQPTARQCSALGTLLARLHAASGQCRLQRQNDRGPDWVLRHAAQLLQTDWHTENEWLAPALSRLQNWYQEAPALPQAIVHGDLFRDNAMVNGDEITGIIDFYNAASGWIVMELAICANDWCLTEEPHTAPVLDATRVAALLDGYELLRPLTQQERGSWPWVLQLAALRFWVSRHQYALQHRGQSGVLIKDPGHFRQLLRYHVLQTTA